ncbi:response regulator [Spirosoma jeollabukense]
MVEDNKDHQLLIAYSLQVGIPRVLPVFAKSPEEALTHLNCTQSDSNDFPRLILLDLFLPDPTQGWQLLTQLRSRYPRLPVIILSSHQDQAIVNRAYELGAHSFLSKPIGLDNWEHCFRILNEYWLNVVTLPSR